MKINRLNNLSFAKKLIATCNIKDLRKSIPCSFYELEDEDRDYFIKLIHKPGWDRYLYSMIIDGDIRRKNVDKIYVLEDNEDNCLGYMKVDTQYEGRNSLEFIEVKPDCKANEVIRRKRHIGETMLNFLAQLTKMNGKDFLIVPYPDSSAVKFYKKCLFSPTGRKREHIISREDMKKLDSQNYAHTGSKIDFEG